MMKEITVEASIENVDTVTDFINSVLSENDCPLKSQMKIDIAIDEIFSNIAYYAYKPSTGNATVGITIFEGPKRAEIKFIDSGIKYNPLEKDDPDVSLGAEERNVGGLGIYMVKKSMDDISYEYNDNKNILTITKIL